MTPIETRSLVLIQSTCFALSSSNMATLDPTTQSNYTQIISKHIHLDWKVDYDALIILELRYMMSKLSPIVNSELGLSPKH